MIPELGPRLRFGKFFTDMPLAHDAPIRFGVKEFREVCRRCADACPPRAKPHGRHDGATHNQSNFAGIRKWNVDGGKCFKFWASQGTECGICIRVCPYEKQPDGWIGKRYFAFWRRLAGTRLRWLAPWLDVRLGFGGRLKPDSWWETRPGR